MTVSTQQVSSIVRQVAAIAAIVLGCLTAVNLPTWVHPILVVAGSIVLAIEHYVSDTSTGNSVPPVKTAPAPAPPVTTV